MLQSHIQSVVSIPSYTATAFLHPSPPPPPPHCGVGAAAPEAGAGWAVKLLVRVYCVSSHRSHTHHHHLSLVTISHHHITTCHTGPHGAGAGLGPRWRCPRTHLRASPCCTCLPEQLSATTAALQPRQPGPARHTGQDSASGVQPHTANTASTASQLAQ